MGEEGKKGRGGNNYRNKNEERRERKKLRTSEKAGFSADFYGFPSSGAEAD